MAINTLYRSTYPSEAAIAELVYKSGEWTSQTSQISLTDNVWPSYGRCAVVFGNGISRKKFDSKLLSNRSLNSIPEKVLRTYGCNSSYKDVPTDFLVVTNKTVLEDVVQNGIMYRTRVFLSRALKLRYPFYPSTQVHNIPQDPPFNAGATAAYLAAFDEHKKVFLLGFDGIDDPNASYNLYEGTPGYPDAPYSEEYWVRSMMEVFLAYPKVDFVRVMPESTCRIPEAWKYAPNFRQINYNQFVLEADL
jgi:hypothetical protein